MKTRNTKHETQSQRHDGAAVIGDGASELGHPSARLFTWSVLVLLLAILTVRLGMTESLRMTLAQKAAAFSAMSGNDDVASAPEIGPSVITGLTVLTLLCAAAAAFLGRAELSRGRLGQFLLIALIVALGLASAFHAANRFAALVGLCDVLTALMAGWAVAILCAPKLLGSDGRRFVLCALVAILAAWCFKGFMERFDEIPQMLDYYQHNKEKVWQQQGFHPGDPAIELFEGRLGSRDVGGFISLSNVMAAGLVGLISVTLGIFVAAIRTQFATLGVEIRGIATAHGPEDQREFPLTFIAIIALALLLLLAFIVLIFTHSKGGTAAAALCACAIFAGMYLHRYVARYRRTIMVAVAVLALLGAGGVLAYGIEHDALPSKSLLFRWHYWTASVPIIKQSPVLGVGLNNFGDYYDEFKRPSSPEDVKDPHSYFVRLAAEMGLPAAALIGLLLLWLIVSACRLPEKPAVAASDVIPAATEPEPSIMSHWSIALAAGAMLLIAWAAHYFTEPPAEWFLYMSIFYALASALMFAAAWCVLRTVISLRPILIATLIGALGMLLYDQINMALVTGPVAMLFWVLLGLADSAAPAAISPAAPAVDHESSIMGRWMPAVSISAAAIGVIGLVWIPLMRDSMAWDPAPLEWSYIRNFAGGDPRTALADLNAALALAPCSEDIIRARIRVKQVLHLPVAEDIRRALSLDRANARPRVELAMPESDLPAGERIAILKQALVLDGQLSKDEPKKLKPEERAGIEAAIKELTKHS